MRLVDSEIVHGDEDEPERPRPPRPEKRRVYVSLFVTISVLAGTAAAVFWQFPARDNELLTVAMSEHSEASSSPELSAPTQAEIRAWSLGVFGETAPFPEADALGARRLSILKRPAAIVFYRLGDFEISFTVLRARDAPPRRYRRLADGLAGFSFRRGHWTCIAVGPAAGAEKWRAALGLR